MKTKVLTLTYLSPTDRRDVFTGLNLRVTISTNRVTVSLGVAGGRWSSSIRTKKPTRHVAENMAKQLITQLALTEEAKQYFLTGLKNWK